MSAILVPTGTYGPIQKVEPIEKDDIISYTDKDGNDYIAVGVDFENEDWFSKLIETEGLENLCQKYPYQPLKVDKNTGLLVPINECDYNAKLTNGFHVIYQMRKEKLEQNNQYGFSRPDTNTQEYGFNVEIESSPSQTPEYETNWASAFHINEPPMPKVDMSLFDLWCESPEDEANKHGMYNIDAKMYPDEGFDHIVPNHPNHFIQQNVYQPQSMYGIVQQQQQNMRQAIYNYNQQQEMQYHNFFANAIPKYSNSYITTINQAHSTGTFSPTFDLLQEESRKAMEREEANMRYASQINQSVTNRVDFSDPSSFSSIQDPRYTDPAVNNLNNPNKTKPIPTFGYDMNIVKQHINPSYFVHNFQNNPNYQPQYSITTGFSGFGYNSRSNYNFVSFNESEKRAGKQIQSRIIRTSEETVIETVKTTRISRKTIQEEINETKKKLASSARVIRVHEVNINGEIKELNDEEYEKFINQTDDNLDIGEATEGRKRYGKSFINGVIELAKQIWVYEKAWSQVLIESMDDIDYPVIDMKAFIQVTKNKIEWYKQQEKVHPDRNYRVDYRYIRTPKPRTATNGDLMFTPEERRDIEYQDRKKYTLRDGKVVDFFKYDRFHEPSEEEWSLFCEEVIYVRNVSVILYKTQDFLETEERNLDIEEMSYHPTILTRLQEQKLREKHMADQYSIYRAAYGTSLSDEDFDKWWYRNDPSTKQNRTEEDEIFEQECKRYQMGSARQDVLMTAVPVDYEKVSQAIQKKREEVVREFDEDIMSDCTSLKDFFDRLHVLVVKCEEATIEEQKKEFLRTAQFEDRDEYHRQLFSWANSDRLGNNRKPGSPYKTYEEFVDTEEYRKRKEEFIRYCDTNTRHIPLRPVFK